MVLDSEGTKVFLKANRKGILVGTSLSLIRNVAIAYVCLSFRDSSLLPLTFDRSQAQNALWRMLENKNGLCSKETLNVCYDGKRKLQEVQGSCSMNVAHFCKFYSRFRLILESANVWAISTSWCYMRMCGSLFPPQNQKGNCGVLSHDFSQIFLTIWTYLLPFWEKRENCTKLRIPMLTCKF